MRAGGARQGELFTSGGDLNGAGGPGPLPPPLLRDQLLAWQARLAAHQAPLFGGGSPGGEQASLFAPAAAEAQIHADGARLEAERLDPLSLHPQSLTFWRWPEAPHRGAAVYLVMDRPANGEQTLLLYVGETGRADRRWKGDHDCKRYLAAYGEALGRAGLSQGLSIRFWCDVPEAVRARRALEQALIRRWLPPFNKETRGRWATPFTAEPE